MALPSCVGHPPQFPLKVNFSKHIVRSQHFIVRNQTLSQIRSSGIGISDQPFARVESEKSHGWTFQRGTRIISRPEVAQSVPRRRSSRVYASWLTNSQIASGVFSVGTVAVLPFYTLMVVAPKTELTRKAVESSVPYVLLGVLYAYLLYLSWTPETFRLIFASQYWLPELPGIAKMFASEMTLASAWIHLLAVDLYAARQVFLDGLENEVDTRLSVSFCLLFCPIGIVAHYITKALTRRARSTGRRVH